MKKKILGLISIFIILLFSAIWGENTLKNNKKELDSLKQELQEFKQLNNKKMIAKKLNDIANIYNTRREYDKVLECYLEALEIEELLGRKLETAVVLYNLGNIYKILSNNIKALEFHLRALKIREEIGDKAGVIESLLDTGHVYILQSKHDTALEYFNRALKVSRAENNRTAVCRSLSRVGIIYHFMKEYNRAIEYYERALQIAREIEFKRGLAYITWYIARVYEDMNNYPLALEYHRNALEIGKKNNDNWISASALISIGGIYIKLRDYDKAKQNINKGHEIAKENNTEDLIIAGYESLSRLYAARGNYKKALEHYQRYHQTDKELIDDRMTRHFNELQTSYEAEKRAREIAKLKNRNDVQQLKLSREKITRNALIIGFILVLIILALLFKKYLHLFAFWKKEKYIGNFRLMDKIGSGGMGTVYKAHYLMDRSEIAAIKVLREELFSDQVSSKRFKRESAIIDKLEHPHIIKVFERGEYKQKLFIAMEFLEGKTLQCKINEEEQLTLKTSIHIMRQISIALAFIHSKNIIHRDLKPANIMLIEKDGDPNFVKLLDFGLAKMEFESRLTQSGNLLGTLQYVAPEQVINADSSLANDIFSMGVTFYRMLCGQAPFGGETVIEIMRQIIGKTPRGVSEFRPDIPIELNDLVMQTITKNPGQRPSAESIHQCLRQFMDL